VRDILLHTDGRFAEEWGLDAAHGGGLFVGHRDVAPHGLPIDLALHGSNQYSPATGTQGVTGHPIDGVNGHPYYKDQSEPTINIDLCLADAQLLIDPGPYTDDFYSMAWVMSLKIVPTSTYGAKSPKSVIITYSIY